MSLEKITILTISFHLLRSSLISFDDVLEFLVCKPCTFVKFIPMYFIIFDALINWIVLSFILDCPLLIHRDAVNFCILITYSATLLKLFISYSICVCIP